MLKQVRKSLKSVVFLFFGTLIVLSFAAWQVPELRSFSPNAALRVGDASFSARDVQAEVQRELTNRRLQSGEVVTLADALKEGLPAQVMNTMATRSVIEQEAKRVGLSIPRDLVRDFLQSAEQFQNPSSGKFDAEAMSAILRNYSISPGEFEEIIRADLLRNQLVVAASSGAGAPDPLVQTILVREIERRDISYVSVTEEMAGIPKEPTPDDFTKYFENNPAQFTAPEFRTFTSVVLQTDDFREGLVAEEDKLREIYDANKTRLYEQPERRTLYQITYDTEAEASAAVAGLADGEPFETVAAERGLTLAAVTFTDIPKSDVLDPNVAEAAFAEDREAGAIVGPVKSLFGFTVAQVVAVTPPETQTFEEVRGDIENELFQADARRALLKAVEAVEEALDTGANLEDAAAAAGVAVDQVGPVDSFSFGPGGEIVADIPGEVLQEAFAMEVGDESPALELAEQKGYFFLALSDVRAPAVFPFEDVADEVEQRWRKEEREERIKSAVEKIRDAAIGGANLAEAAAPFNAEPATMTLSRQPEPGSEFARPLVDEIFTADKGAVVIGDFAAGGARAVVVVDDVRFLEDALKPGQEIGVVQFLGYQLDQELLEAYAGSLRQDYEVRINQAAVDAAFANDQ